MRLFTRLLKYAKPYSRFCPGYLIFSILSVIFGVVNYALIKPLLEVLLTLTQWKNIHRYLNSRFPWIIFMVYSSIILHR